MVDELGPGRHLRRPAWLCDENPRPAHVGEFELEVSTQRWTWSPQLFDIIGVPTSFQPSTVLLMATTHPDDRRVTRQAIAEALTSGRSFHYESRVVRADGHVRILETTATIAV